MNAAPSAVRIGLVEDNDNLRTAMKRMFNSAPGFTVVASCPDAETALRELPSCLPDVVLMDIQLPGMSGIQCVRQLKALLPTTRVVMVTVYDDNDSLFQSLVAGADGYLIKSAPRQRMIESIREIATGGSPVSPQIARRMIEHFRQNGRSAPASTPQSTKSDLASLTAQEQEILSRLAAGLAPKEVAAQLGISWETVRKHTSNIYEKLHVHSRVEAVLKFMGRSARTVEG